MAFFQKAATVVMKTQPTLVIQQFAAMRNNLSSQLAILEGCIEAAESTSDEDSILETLNRFDAVVRQMEKRDRKKPPLTMEDEYDVQYLLAALLRLKFRQVVLEDPIRKRSGGSGRIDISLPTQRTWIETKFARPGDTEKKFRDEFAKDFELYRNGDLDVLYCFVYDPDRVLREAAEMEEDLSEQRDKFETIVVVRP